MTRARFDRRRLFAGGLAAPLLLSGRGGAAPRATAGPKVGCQEGPTTDEWLRFFARHGVRNICGVLPSKDGTPYTVEELSALRERCLRHGVSLDMMTDPNLRPTPIDESHHAALLLGPSPERDREIEKVQTLIRNCAKAGIPAIRYNLTIVGYQRSGKVQGPGGASYAVWRLKDVTPLRNRPTRAGRVNADTFWERITYFLDRVIPVANEHKVRMACHPHDPPTPPGFQGVDSVLGTVEGLKKFVTIRDSPYHGLNFCQGTIATMLADPPREIFDVIRHFATRKKIFNVHFRNIHGARDDFEERLPDTGDIDFVKAMHLYKELGYDGMMMPDHVPKSPDDPEERQALAYCYGYIKALIQSA